MKFECKTLGELSINGKGSYGIAAAAVEYSPDLYTYLRITDIDDDGTIKKDTLMSVNDERASEYLLRPNDIVFARTGASTGRNYFFDGSDGEFVYAGFLIKFSLDIQKINPYYIKYFCQSNIYKQWIQSFKTGSTRGNINAKTYSEMPIPVPARKQQDFLVSILKPIDDKIAINNAINKHLEEQAQAIYKEMVSNCSAESVRVGILSDIAEITMGQSPKGDTYNETGEGTVFYQGRAEFGFRFPKQRLFTTEPKRMAKEDDVLMSVRAPVGDINVARENCCIGRGLASIRSKFGYQSFVLYTMYSLREQMDVFNGEGTVFGAINRAALNALPIVIPPKEHIERFESIVSPMDASIRINHEEICRLKVIRDTLLPRLMSGEIDVSDIEI